MLVDEYQLLPSDGRNHFRPEELGNSIVIKIYIALMSQLRVSMLDLNSDSGGL